MTINKGTSEAWLGDTWIWVGEYTSNTSNTQGEHIINIMCTTKKEKMLSGNYLWAASWFEKCLWNMSLTFWVKCSISRKKEVNVNIFSSLQVMLFMYDIWWLKK